MLFENKQFHLYKFLNKQNGQLKKSKASFFTKKTL